MAKLAAAALLALGAAAFALAVYRGPIMLL